MLSHKSKYGHQSASPSAVTTPQPTPQLESLYAKSPEYSYLTHTNSNAQSAAVDILGGAKSRMQIPNPPASTLFVPGKTGSVQNTEPLSFGPPSACIGGSAAHAEEMAAAVGNNGVKDIEGQQKIQKTFVTNQHGNVPHFGTEPYQKEHSKSYLDDIMEADRRITKTLSQEVDGLELTLKSLNDQFERLEGDLRSAQREIERKNAQHQDLVKQGEYMSGRLTNLTEERRIATVTGMNQSKEKKVHLGEEMMFLEDVLGEALKHVDGITDVNAILEKHFHAADLQLQSLEKQRREIVSQIATEKEALKKDERENSRLKTGLESLQRKLLIVNSNLTRQQTDLIMSPKNRVSISELNKLDGGRGTFSPKCRGAPGAENSSAYSSGFSKYSSNTAHNPREQEPIGHSWAGLLKGSSNSLSDGTGGGHDAGLLQPARRNLMPRSFDREGV